MKIELTPLQHSALVNFINLLGDDSVTDAIVSANEMGDEPVMTDEEIGALITIDTTVVT
jgi:hypothetical protein